MAKNPAPAAAANPASVQGLDWASLITALSPVFQAMLLALLEKLKKKEAGAIVGHHCPDECMSECCDQLIQHQIDALVHAAHLKQCCHPDPAPEPTPTP